MHPEWLISRLRSRVEVDDGLPLHERLTKAITAAILDKQVRQGDALPGERNLAEALGVSRVTVRKSIETLVHEGLVSRRHGARTEIGSRVEKSLARLTSFSEDAEADGSRSGAIWLSRHIGRATPNEVLTFGIAPDAGVVRLRRVRTVDGVAMALETAAVPSRFLPSPNIVDVSLYAALDRLGFLPQRAMQSMRARVATAGDAEHLRCELGAPILAVERRGFLPNGEVVEISETRYRGDACNFSIELKR